MRTIFRLLIIPPLLIFLLYNSRCSKDTSVENNGPQTGYLYQQPEKTDDGWVTNNLYYAGMNAGPIAAMMNNLQNRNDHYVDGILIVRYGKLVFEEYFDGYDMNHQFHHYDKNALHYQASVSKSVTSALFGIALDMGFIDSTEQKLFDALPQYSNLSNEEKDKITLHHMLSMSSGLDWDEWSYPYTDYRNDVRQLFTQSDPIRFVIAKPMLGPAGTIFHYNSGTTCVLGDLVRQKSAMILKNFAEEYLFTPLGITVYNWEMLRTNITFASGGLYLRPRDMAKIGQLYLQEGIWDGNQIISKEWIKKSIESSIAPPPDNFFGTFCTGYGYQWWLGRYSFRNLDVYFAAGWGEQYIIVIPSESMIIVLTGGAYYSSSPFPVLITLVNDYILESLTR